VSGVWSGWDAVWDTQSPRWRLCVALLTCPRHVGRKRFAYGRNPGDRYARRDPPYSAGGGNANAGGAWPCRTLASSFRRSTDS